MYLYDCKLKDEKIIDGNAHFIRRHLISLLKNTAIITTVFVALFLIGASVEIPNENAGTTYGLQITQENIIASNDKTVNVSKNTNSVTESEKLFTAERIAKLLAQRLPSEITPYSIFLNNMKVLLFASFLYPIGVIVTWMTAIIAGLGFSAFASLAEVEGLNTAFQVLMRPFFWLEVTAYSLAAAQSIHISESLRGRVGVKDITKLNAEYISGILRVSGWRKNWERDKAVPRGIHLLRVLLHIDLFSIDKIEVKRQLMTTGIIIAVSTLLLSFAAIAEVHDINTVLSVTPNAPFR